MVARGWGYDQVIGKLVVGTTAFGSATDIHIAGLGSAGAVS